MSLHFFLRLSVWKKNQSHFFPQCEMLQRFGTSSDGAVRAQTLLSEEMSAGDLLKEVKPLRSIAPSHCVLLEPLPFLTPPMCRGVG